jgi:hypothetical protein
MILDPTPNEPRAARLIRVALRAPLLNQAAGTSPNVSPKCCGS